MYLWLKCVALKCVGFFMNEKAVDTHTWFLRSHHGRTKVVGLTNYVFVKCSISDDPERRNAIFD